jgi:hypothetical protein
VHRIFPTQELILAEDVTMMVALGLSRNQFKSLFVDIEWVLILYSKLGPN